MVLGFGYGFVIVEVLIILKTKVRFRDGIKDFNLS